MRLSEGNLHSADKQAPPNFDTQAKEDELNGMVIERLREMARTRKLSTLGDKGKIIDRIINDMTGVRTETYSLLEEAIMSWKVKEQQEYLKRMKEVIYGTKSELTARIMAKVPIDDAVTITRNYRSEMKEGKKSKEKLNGQNMEIDSQTEITDVEMQNIEQALKRAREDSPVRTPAITREYEETPPPPPPRKVAGTTASKDTSIVAAPRGGNDLINLVTTEGALNINIPGEIQVGERERNNIRNQADEAGWITPQRDGGRNADEDTVTQDNLSELINRRYGLMLTTPPSNNEPDKLLVLAAKEWFKKMMEYDNRFCVLPWKAANTSAIIRKPSDIPSSIGKFREYFHRAQVKTKGGQINVDVHLGHTMDMKELLASIDWYFQQKGNRIYFKSIQAEEITQMGWLLYSSGNMDQAALSAAITAASGVTVGLRYKYINTASYETDREERKKWMAFHLEVDTKEAKKAERSLKRLYGTTSTAFPLGIRMRLISEYRHVKGNPTNSAKHTRLRLRQANFVRMVKGCPGDDIAQLDFRDASLDNNSLRDMIMSINSSNPNTPGSLYHSVGLDWKGRYIFSFLAHKEEEAIMVADGIIPYILHHYGDEATSFFDPDALLEKEDWKWDPSTNSIVNPLTSELDVLEKLDGDFTFDMEVVTEASTPANDSEHRSPPTAQELAIAKMNVLINDQDAETVSTMGTSPKPLGMRLIRNTPGKQKNGSVFSCQSQESRLTAVEDSISSMEETLKATIQASMKEMMTQLMGQGTPPAASAGVGQDE